MNGTALVRRMDSAKLMGVCAGIGRYLGIDPTIVRLAFVICTVFGLGSPILLYFCFWISMSEPSVS
jgi:phage shock protein C